MKNFTFNTTIKAEQFSRIKTLLFLLTSIMVSPFAFGQVPFSSSGNFIPPAGITSLTSIQAWGAGGGGSDITSSSRRGGGGGGGAFAATTNFTVSALTTYPVVIGLGGAGSTDGGNTTFNTTTVRAAGGTSGDDNGTGGGAGGTVAASLPATGTRLRGGNGGTGGGTSSGGGGGGAGSSAIGKDAGTAPAAGGSTTVNGGAGAAGVSGGSNGSNGLIYGGGGSGASTNSGTDRNGGRGADGYLTVSYATCPTYSLTSTSAPLVGCQGSTATVTLVGTLPVGKYKVTYNTSNPSVTGLTAIVTVNTANTITFQTPTLSNTGNNTVTITSITSGSVDGGTTYTLCNSAINANNTATISVQTKPATPGAITGTSTVCAGIGYAYSISAVAFATSYTWTAPAGWSITGQGTAAITATPTAAGQDGDITVTATNATCGTSTAQTFAVTAVTTPTIPGAISGSAAVCPGITTLTYSVAPVTYATSYNWNVPTGWTITAGAGTNSITVTSGAIGEDGNITVSATNATCATTGPLQTKAVTVPAAPLDFAVGSAAATICEGTGTDITLAGSESGVTYELRTVGGSLITTVAGTGSPIVLPTGPLAGTTTFRVDAIKIAGCFTTMSLTAAITVEQAPTVNAGTDDNVCQTPTPSAITLSGATIGGSATTGTWSIFSGTGTLSDILPTASPELVTFTPDANYTGDVVLHLTTDAFGACSPVTGTRTIHVRPLPIVYNVGGGTTICEGLSTNITLNGSQTNVTYQLRDASDNPVGTPVVGTGAGINLPTGVLSAGNTFNVYATKNDGTGCNIAMSGTAAIAVTAAPSAPGAIIAAANPSCGPTTLNAYTSVPVGQTYYWQGTTNNGTSTALDASLDYSVNTVGTFTYYVRAREGLCWSTTPTSLSVTYNPVPSVNSKILTATCSGVAASFTPVNVTDGSIPAGTTYSWLEPVTSGITGTAAGSGASSIGGTLTNTTSGSIDVVYTVTPTGVAGPCSGTPFTVTIPVKPRPAINTLSPSVCSASILTVSPADGTDGVVPTGTTYTWIANPTRLPTNGSITGYSILANQTSIIQTLTNTTNAAATATYTITPTTSGCVGNAFTLVATVNPKPAITNQTQTVCGTAAFTVTPTTTIVPSGTVYSWSAPTGANFTGGALGSGTGSITGTLTNSTNAQTTATYTGVIPTSSVALGSCAGSPFNVVITLNPTPQLVPQTTSVCSATGFNFAPANGGGNILTTGTGTRYSWGAPGGSGFTGGAASVGNVNSITGNLTNTTNTPVTAIYTVTPRNNNGSGTCIGGTFTLTVTVNPKPIIAAKSQTICSGDVFSVTPVNGVGGDVVPSDVSYSWTAPVVAGVSGTAASTPGATSISGTLTNATNTDKTVVYNVTATSAAGTCTGTFSVTVTVHPRPSINTQNKATCSGTAFSVNPINGVTDGIVPANTLYTWTTPVITPGAGDITGGSAQMTGVPAAFGQTLTNTTSGTPVATYTVTPTSSVILGSCVGGDFTVAVTLNPTPVIGNKTSTICSGSAFTTTLVDAPPTEVVPLGTTYSWGAPAITDINGPAPLAVAGGSALSNQSSIGQILTNVTNTLAYATYTVTPKIGTCTGATFTVTVTVNPSPVIAARTAIICDGGTFTVSPSNGLPTSATIVPTGTTYTWGTPVIFPLGAITGGSDQLVPQTEISQTLANTTNAPATATYTVTPHGPDCDGSTFTVTVTVNPTPAVTSDAVGAGPVCTANPVIPQNYAITSNVTGATFAWSRAFVSADISPATNSGTTSSITEVLANGSTAPIGVRYVIVPTANGCPGPSFNYDVTVMPHTDVTITSENAAICNPAVVDYTILGSGAVDSFRWSRPAVTGISNPAVLNKGTASKINETLNSSLSSDVPVTYAITAMKNGCPGDIGNYIVTVRPSVNLPGQTANACSGQLFTFGPANASSGTIPADTKFTWGVPNPVDPGVTGGSAQPVLQDFITQTLTNSTSTVKNAYYNVGAKSLSACVGGAFTLTVKVNPTPSIQVSPSADQLVCSGLALTTVALSNATAITGSLSWARDNTTNLTGMGATGGASIAGTLINQTNINQISTFTAKTTLGTCSTTTSLQVTVKPAATAAVDLATQASICSGDAITTINITNPNGIPGTDYTWSRNNLANLTGLESGNGNTIAGTLTNGTGTPQSTTFTITPVAASCNGGPVTAIVTVKPRPHVTAARISTAVICSGSPISSITVGQKVPSVSGTSYSWTRTNGDMSSGALQGMNAFGSGASISGTLINTTGTAQTAQFTITATANFCSSDTTIDVVVNPAPILTVPGAQFLCTGATMADINVTDNLVGTSYSWVRTNGDIATGSVRGLASSGTGSTIIGTALTNATTITRVTTFTFTATASVADGSCPSSGSVPVTVYAPLTAPVIGQSQTLCNNANPAPFTITTTPTGGNGYTYQWQRSDNNEVDWYNVGTLNAITYSAPSNTNADYRLVVTSPCGGTLYSNSVFTQTNGNGGVLPLYDATPNPVCNGATFAEPINFTVHSNNNRLRFAWNADANYVTVPTGEVNGVYSLALGFIPGSSGSIPLTYKNLTNAPVSTTVGITTNLYNQTNTTFQCSAAPVNFTITINPTPVATASAGANTICSNSSPGINITSNVQGGVNTTFRWTRDNTGNVTGAGTGGAGTTQSTVAPGVPFALPGSLINNTNSEQLVTYKITPRIVNGGTTCDGSEITVSVTVLPNVTQGTLTTSQVICSGEAPTIALTGTTNPTDPNVSYQWQSTTGGCNGTYTNVDGAISQSYSVLAGLTSTTHFRRLVAYNNGISCNATAASNCVAIYVNTMTAGAITGEQTICPGTIPSTFGSTAATAPGGGVITYQWQGRAGTDPDCTTGFADIAGATAATYKPSGLADSTYRRVATSTLTVAGATPNPQTCTAISNCVRLYLNSVAAGAIANTALNNQTFCGDSDPVSLTSATDGSGTSVTYQWMFAKGDDCNVSFSNVASSPIGTQSTYDPSVLDTTTTFKRVTISTLNGVGCTDTSSCETITILNIRPGLIGKTQAVCGGVSAQPFTSDQDASAGGTFSYKWESSTSIAGPFDEILGATDSIYAYPDPVNQNLYFQRVAYGTIGIQACEVRTPIITLFVNDPKAGQVDAPLCNSSDPAQFIETVLAEGGGSGAGFLTYQWWEGSSPTGPWTDIPGATDSVYNPPAGQSSGSHYYYRVVTSELASKFCQVDGNVVTVKVYPGSPGTWTGAGVTDNTDWFNCANWSAGAVPTTAMAVTIPFVANQPTIDRNSSYITGSDRVAHTGNLTLWSPLNFTNTNDTLHIAGNLLIEAQANPNDEGLLDLSGGGNVHLEGNWENTRGSLGFIPDNGNVRLTGSGATQRIITPETFSKLTINHTGAGVTLENDVRITDSLNFVSGYLTTTTSPGGLTLSPAAIATGASDNSFANGPVAKETNTTNLNVDFTFPIGKGTTYMPAGVRTSLDDGVGVVTYTGEYFPLDPAATFTNVFVGTTATTLMQASNYWDIAQSGAGTFDSARVILYYQNNARYAWPAGPSNPARTNVAVAHYGAPTLPNVWSFTRPDLGFEVQNTPYEAIPYLTGTLQPVYSGVMGGFSPFTLAYGQNVILPIKLIGFEGRLMGSDGALSWKVSSASDLAGFELQYSTNGTTYKKLADIPANGATVYSYLDKQLPIGARFYRLLVKEKGGNSLHSAVIMLTLDGQKTSITGLSHTIVREQSVTGKIVSAKAQGIRALISDVSGRQIAERRGRLQAGNNQWLINTGFLASGMYFVTILTDDGVKATLQFVKE